MPDIASLSGKEKAAVFLLSLGEEEASNVMKQLDQAQMSQLSNLMARMRRTPSDVVSAIHDEYRTRATDRNVVKGGTEVARKVLAKVVGVEQASKILEGAMEENALETLKWMDIKGIVSLLKGEHPQTVALIVAHLDPEKAASVLSELPDSLRVDVAFRMANLEGIPKDVLRDLEDALRVQMKGAANLSEKKVGGIKAVAEILNRVERSTEEFIMERIDEENPELAESIRKLMFVFDDLVEVDDRGIQSILKEVGTEELSLALKTASDEMKEKVFKNMSKRAAQILKEDMESRGPTRLSDIEKAQQAIVNIARRLESEGQIILGGKGGEEMVV